MYKVEIRVLERIKKHLQKAEKQYVKKPLDVSDEESKKLSKERRALIKLIEDNYNAA